MSVQVKKLFKVSSDVFASSYFETEDEAQKHAVTLKQAEIYYDIWASIPEDCRPSSASFGLVFAEHMLRRGISFSNLQEDERFKIALGALLELDRLRIHDLSLRAQEIVQQALHSLGEQGND